MFLLVIIVIAGIIYVFFSQGIKIASLIGGVLGFFIGSGFGIAGGGTAINAAFIFSGVGFIIGGLMSKSETNVKVPQKTNSDTSTNNSSASYTNLTPEILSLIQRKDALKLATLMIEKEKKGDYNFSRQLMRTIRSANSDLGHNVKEIKDNLTKKSFNRK